MPEPIALMAAVVSATIRTVAETKAVMTNIATVVVVIGPAMASRDTKSTLRVF